MLVMQQVMMIQEKLLTGFGPDNPFVKPDNVHNVVSKLVEAAGLKTPALYFTKPDEQEVQAKMEAMRNQPNPEQMKMQAQMQLEQAKMQVQMQLEQAKMAAARDKESAQMEADLQVKQADIQANAVLEEQKAGLEREKMYQARELKMAELAQQRELALLQMGMRDNEDGKPASREDDRNGAFLSALEQVAGLIGQLQQSSNLPKRVVRDENGDVVGVETYQPEMVN
jgi:hypothetical protein